jgi:membrane protease YdiL (CAAX protease family)
VTPRFQHVFLVGEFLVLFFLLPVGFRFKPFPMPLLPPLWLLAGYCFYQLLKDPGFDRSLLRNERALAPAVPRMLPLFFALASLIGCGVFFLRPEKLFYLVQHTPWLWAAVMVLYPVLSVYPQGIIYRAFLFHRYRDLLRTPRSRVLASAMAFCFGHIIFRNPVAVSLTLVGGLLFAWRYQQSRSLVTSAFEHALYGCWIFTIGLGDLFYRGMG